MLPSSLRTIGPEAFYNCAGLRGTITIPEGTTHIGELAFCGCSEVSEVVLPRTVRTIGKAAFNNCTKLASVAFDSADPPDVGEQAFEGCPCENDVLDRLRKCSS